MTSPYATANVWGNTHLYLAVNCLPREDYSLSSDGGTPLNAVDTSESARAAAAAGLTTIATQQRAVAQKFAEKTATEARYYPYRYCVGVSDSDITPRTMRENAQIGLTPDRAAAVVRNLRRGMFANALRDVATFEEANHQTPLLPPAKVANANATTATANTTAIAPPTLTAASTPTPPIPTPTPAAGAFGGCTSSVVVNVSPFNGGATPVPATAVITDSSQPQQPQPLSLPSISPFARFLHARIPWGFFQSDAKLVGAERWTVRRCDRSTHVYRVNYFKLPDGDAFYSKVVPTDAAGLIDFIKLKWRGYI